MISFDEVMTFTRKWSSHAAFEDECCRLLYDVLITLPQRSVVLEVGVEYGRSTSVILQVARENNHQVILIDPFVDPKSFPSFAQMAVESQCSFALLKMPNKEADKYIWSTPPYGLVHIDGSHTKEDLEFDCAEVLSFVHQDGYACFHDYTCDSLPDVRAVVDERMTSDKWERVGLAHSLIVFRRL